MFDIRLIIKFGATVDNSAPYIAIKITGNLTDSIGGFNIAPNGKQYWITDLVIENHGYNQFPVDPNYFSAIVGNNTSMSIDPATSFLSRLNKKPLSNLTLSNGRRIAGSLAFKLPHGPHSIKYSGPGDFAIEWNAQGE